MTDLLATKTLKIAGLVVGGLIFVASFVSSVLFGLTELNWNLIIEAYTRFDGSNEHIIVKTARMPRAVIAAVIGASLAMAGSLMQALTRNPLASPSVFGLNAGASFFIVLAVSFFSLHSLSEYIWVAFAGAAVSALAIYLLSNLGRDGMTPIKITLAGAAMAALFSSMTHGLLVINERALEEVLFWLAGSVEGRKLEMLFPILPFLLIAWISAMLMARQVNILMLGEDVAKGLGQRTAVAKLFIWSIVVLLAGGSVAVAGPVGFIGIIIPHIVRALVGSDYRWILPYCALLGGILVLLADLAARYVIMPKEVPVGVMTALIGVPFFLYLARRGIRS